MSMEEKVWIYVSRPSEMFFIRCRQCSRQTLESNRLALLLLSFHGFWHFGLLSVTLHVGSGASTARNEPNMVLWRWGVDWLW
jgi:hypothetical protein